MILGKDRERIRTVFLDRAETYDVADAAWLGRMSVRVLRRDLDAGNRDGVRCGDSWRLNWQQVALLIFERWSLADIHEALGEDAPKVLPSLLSLRTVSIRLPEFIVRALELIAREDRTTLDHVLHNELIDFAGTAADRYGRRIRGYREAYFYPGRPVTEPS